MKSLRIGTRGSPLALWQARHVVGLLGIAQPDIVIELVEIETAGDQIRDVPLTALGGDGAFTKAIQQALLEERVDIAVHSLKDLPTFEVGNLVLAATPPRGPVGDVLVSTKHSSFNALPHGAAVGSSSLRRRAQLLYRRPDLKVVDMRGNVETRLRKLAELNLDAIILAQAGLERLGLEKNITEVLDAAWMLPAAGQGALGLECRGDDIETVSLLKRIDDPPTHAAVLAERAMLRGLGGGCQVPIGAATVVHGRELTLRGVVLSPDGRQRIEAALTAPPGEAEMLGCRVADDLLSQAAREILASVAPGKA